MNYFVCYRYVPLSIAPSAGIEAMDRKITEPRIAYPLKFDETGGWSAVFLEYVLCC